MLRTEELLAVHKFDGAEQYFTRAVDFGFSFSVEETLEKWGGQAILGDYVRMIRTIRPDVMVGFVYDGEGGGQHHQASARLSAAGLPRRGRSQRVPRSDRRRAAAVAGEEVLLHGAVLRPAAQRRPPLTGEGASSMLMFTGGDTYDPVLGRTCNEIAGEARSMHKCQGMSQLLPLPGVNAGLRLGPARLPPARHGAARRREPSRPRDVRRRGHGAVEPGRLRRRAAAGRADGRPDAHRVERGRRPRRRGRQGLGRRRRAAGRRAEGGARAARRARRAWA